ncbi:hypothetical protein ACOI1C_06495 [Bacillus sp. DJP31]|uniref:hypothetical protein n=1 Tax=Bacillus sp. DJP31 TaxID=3409789 RepID=UPI003BB5967E
MKGVHHFDKRPQYPRETTMTLAFILSPLCSKINPSSFTSIPLPKVKDVIETNFPSIEIKD